MFLEQNQVFICNINNSKTFVKLIRYILVIFTKFAFFSVFCIV